MENQHQKIKGYRDLSQEEIDLMNKVKTKGEELRALVAEIRQVCVPEGPVISAAGDTAEGVLVEGLPMSAIEHEGDDPAFWLRYADGALRVGLMYAVRAIAQPTSY